MASRPFPALTAVLWGAPALGLLGMTVSLAIAEPTVIWILALIPLPLGLYLALESFLALRRLFIKGAVLRIDTEGISIAGLTQRPIRWDEIQHWDPTPTPSDPGRKAVSAIFNGDLGASLGSPCVEIDLLSVDAIKKGRSLFVPEYGRVTGLTQQPTIRIRTLFVKASPELVADSINAHKPSASIEWA